MAKQIKLKRYEPLDYYEKMLKKLDMQAGECYAAFDRDHNLSSMWLFIGQKKGIGGEIVYGVKKVIIRNRGFARTDFYMNPNSFRNDAYTHVVQVDRKRFDTLDKAIGLLNTQISAYQGEFKNLIEE